jgi:ribonuclease HII
MVIPTLKLEESLWQKGYRNVVGIDEAGRGPLAGPVVAGAVVIHTPEQLVEGVKDSKKMTARRRKEACEKIKEVSSAWGVGIVEAGEIDRIGIQKAVQKAMQGALGMLTSMLKKNPDFLIVDGRGVLKIAGYEMLKITRGDQDHYSIAAASVLAKVTRDELMHEYALKFPKYGFERHVGYGTAMHLQMLRKYGPTEIHRRSFSPVSLLV